MHSGVGESGRLEAGLGVLLLAALGIMPPDFAGVWRLLPGLLASGLAAWLWRSKRDSSALRLALVVAGLGLGLGAGLLWQVALLLGLWFLNLCARFSPGVEAFKWERGTVPLLGTFICGAITPFALSAWVYFLQPDLSDFAAKIPAVAPWLLFVGALVFALVNALFEECVWRGVMQSSLASLWGVPAAIVIQAVSFGVAHSWGFPRGVVGVMLAGSWALMLGILRQASGGLLAPFVAHVVADATIAVIVLSRLA